MNRGQGPLRSLMQPLAASSLEIAANLSDATSAPLRTGPLASSWHFAQPSLAKAALPLLENSLAEYRKLVKLTDATYLDGDSLHTYQRKIPFVAGPNKYIHFRHCLPEYEKETENFRRNLKRLQADPAITKNKKLDYLFE